MTGSVGFEHRNSEQYYPQTLELTSVYNGGSLNASTKQDLKKNKTRENLTFKQCYPQTLELTSVYNCGSSNVSTKQDLNN